MNSHLKFSKFTPKEYGIIPTTIRSNNELSIVHKNLLDHFEMAPEVRNKNMSHTEHAAYLADIYFDTPEGKSDMHTLRDISNKIAISFTRAFELIQDHIHPRISQLLTKIDDLSKKKMDKALGYEDEHGSIKSSAPKMYLLDIEDLYTRYRSTANDFVAHLSDKYQYNVEYLNDSNVVGLLNRTTATNDINIQNDILLKILKDVEVTVVSSSNGDVVVDTNDPDSVTVEGATKNDIIEDDQSSTSIDSESNEDPDPLLDDEDKDINTSVTTDNDNANITININGEVVTTEEKELLAMMVRSCFNGSSFNVLRTKLFAPKGSVTHKNLTDVLFIVRNPIRDVLEEVAELYLSDLQMSMLRSNFRAMTELQMGGVIYLDIMAVPFADKIIIGPNLLNKNLINRAKADGVDVYPLIRNHLRVYHNDNKDDIYYEFVQHNQILNGVTYEDLLSSSYDVQQKLTDVKEITKAKYAALISRSRASAYKEVMTSYVRELSESSTEAMLKVSPNNKTSFISECDKFINESSKVLESSSQHNVEDMLYELLLNRWYKNTIVGDIYRNFQERVKLAANENNLNDETLATIKAQVVATLGTKFLFDKFI